MSSPIEVDVTGHVALITLNRPEVRNAISPELAAALSAAMMRIEADPLIWVSILTGTGSVAFSAGADLNSVAEGKVEQLWVDPGGFGGFVEFPRSKPVIAAVNGVALAGGFELALASDIVLAVPHAKFGLPEVTRGLIAAAGGVFRLPRRIPLNRAVELIITGGAMSSAEAHQLGLVNRIVESNNLLGLANEVAMKICENSPVSVRESLAMARRAAELTERDAWKEALAARNRVLASDDAKEGPRAFLEKRAPQWRGK